jgi:hypothetical protein
MQSRQKARAAGQSQGRSRRLESCRYPSLLCSCGFPEAAVEAAPRAGLLTSVQRRFLLAFPDVFCRDCLTAHLRSPDASSRITIVTHTIAEARLVTPNRPYPASPRSTAVVNRGSVAGKSLKKRRHVPVDGADRGLPESPLGDNFGMYEVRHPLVVDRRGLKAQPFVHTCCDRFGRW